MSGTLAAPSASFTAPDAGVGLVDVNADEGHAAAERRRDLLEDRELLPAGRTPGAPFIDENGVAAERAQLRLKRPDAAAEQAVCLGVE